MGDRVLRLSPWILIGWTVALWLSRLRNVLTNEDLTSTGRGLRVGVVVVFVALAAGAALGVRRKRLLPLAALVVWTIGYWLVRGTGILIGDWTISFKVVHTVLMVVSIGLAALVVASGGRGVGDAEPLPEARSTAAAG